MKKVSLLILLSVLVISFFITSCQKEVYDRDILINDVAGSYTGSLIPENGISSKGKADVLVVNENQLEIHCYGELLDTTFIMDAYEHGDSIMLCSTGEDFYHEYSHMKGEMHRMDMGKDQSEWMHHMDDEHEDGDEHYGGFDMQNHTFNFSFRMMKYDSEYMIGFSGMKQ